LGEISGFIHGLRDFYIERSQNVIFVLSSDMNVASRFDAYLTNMKMPWEKEVNKNYYIGSTYIVGCRLSRMLGKDE